MNIAFVNLVFVLMGFHAFHTSITRIDFNPKEKSLEVSIRVFTDDFEAALAKDNNGQKFVVTNNDKNDAAVEKYIRKHFALINDQKQKKSYQYIGKEQEADATWIYIEVPLKENLAGLTLQHDVLQEVFDDQVNLVNIKYNSSKKSYIFKKNEAVHLLEL
jgi:hypothetical protein